MSLLPGRALAIRVTARHVAQTIALRPETPTPLKRGGFGERAL